MSPSQPGQRTVVCAMPDAIEGLADGDADPAWPLRAAQRQRLPELIQWREEFPE